MDSPSSRMSDKDNLPIEESKPSIAELTELERLRKELKKSKNNERRYMEFYNNATDIVFTVDRKGRFRTGNDRIFEVIGYTVKEGIALDWNQLVAPHEWNRASQIYCDHAAGKDTLFFELDLVTKEGEICTVEINSRPVIHRSKVIGFHGIARDISERKGVEKSLEQARVQAEEAQLSKSRLLAKVSHEIRTPLHGVMNLLTAIDTSKLSETDQQMVVPIDRSIRHLIHLVDDTLNFAYLESGESTVRTISFSLSQIAKACAARHKHAAEQKHLFLHLDFDSKIPERISGDATKITQILDNLITNAIRYTAKGGVSIKISNVIEETERPHIVIVVSDTGPGISEPQIKHIFEPFQQGDNSKTQTNAGVGLGLAITKRLVETLGCTLQAKSKLGTGSQFILTIPHTSAEISKTVVREIPQFDGTQQTALVIDDDEISNKFLLNTLTAIGLEVNTCCSGREAQNLLQSKPFDLVFMDQHLGDIPGIELAKQIRNDSNARTPKIICVTADIELHQTQIDKSPFDYILLKPCSKNDLIYTLGILFGPKEDKPVNTILDKSTGIDLASGDHDIWEKALGIFTKKLPPALDQLQSLQQKEGFAELKEVAHKLAGSSRYVGAHSVAECCINLVTASKSENILETETALKTLALAVESFLSLTSTDTGPSNY